MADVIFIVITVLFFVISWLYVRAAIVCKRAYGTGILDRSNRVFSHDGLSDLRAALAGEVLAVRLLSREGICSNGKFAA